MMKMKIPRVLLCAGASNSGKTLITCGILQAIINRGLTPASFKCGPDYIDPMFHTRVIGTCARNLDTFFAGSDTVRYILAENSKGAHISVLEGVMGYYDGIGGITTEASTYQVAKVTETPAVLIVNCKGMSLSAAAFVQGYMNFREDSNIKAVILNRVSPSIYNKLKTCIEENCHVKVLGYVPEAKECVIESRHLGLVMPDEISDLKERLMRLAEIIENTVNLDMLLEIAGNAPDIEVSQPELYAGKVGTAETVGVNEAIETTAITKTAEESGIIQSHVPVKVALAKDEAFCFIYEDNIELLKKMGAEILEFSPLHDRRLPEGAEGLILYGGYPELYAKQLSDNLSMLEDIASKCRAGIPLLAECGGFMYLHDTIEDIDGKPHKGVGIIKGKAFKTSKLGRFGYINLTVENGEFFREWSKQRELNGRQLTSFREGADSIISDKIGVMPAHEFHYFDSTDPGQCLLAQKPASSVNWRCVHSTPTMLAGFPHFYYYGNIILPLVFIEKCKKYRSEHLKG